MYSISFFVAIISVAVLAVRVATATNASYLRTTALVTTPHNVSALQCWEFNTPLMRASDAGTAGTLALPLLTRSAGNISYNVLPPRFDGGLHTAPRLQFVLFTSGLAHVSLPSSPAEAYVLGGSGAGLIVAADTTGSGHYTRYPSDQSTVALQVPFEMADVPGQRVVDDKAACVGSGMGQVIEHA